MTQVDHTPAVPSTAPAQKDDVNAIDLVVTDLDGTLWDGDVAVHDRTLAAVATLEERDVPLLVATGRRRRSAQQALAAAGLAPPAVLLDGALGIDLATGAEFHRRSFGPDRAGLVLDAFLAQDLQPCVYIAGNGTDVVVGSEPATHPRHLDALEPWLRRGDLAAATAHEDVLCFGIVGGDRGRLDEVAASLAPHASALVTDDRVFGGATVMVAPHQVTKWDGVEAFCRARGLDPTRVLAIGDGENDVELLRRSAVACVVEDGCAEALACADVVVGPAVRGGWAELLDHL